MESTCSPGSGLDFDILSKEHQSAVWGINCLRFLWKSSKATGLYKSSPSLKELVFAEGWLTCWQITHFLRGNSSPAHSRVLEKAKAASSVLWVLFPPRKAEAVPHRSWGKKKKKNLACRMCPVGAPDPKQWPPKESSDAALWFGPKQGGVISG